MNRLVYATHNPTGSVAVKITEVLREGKFVKRYKRFFADVLLRDKDGGETLVVAHVPNTGSLKTCLFEGSDCIVSESTNPARKLKATLHFLKTPTSWVGVNTSLPNALVHEAWSEGAIEEWKSFAFARREFKISAESRLDLVLAKDAAAFESRANLHHVEVKNVTYAQNGIAKFPDAVTERGQKHLRDLIKLKSDGHGAELVFVIQREDCTAFSPADEIDPEYGRLLRKAVAAGVNVRALSCKIVPSSGVTIHPVPMKLRF